MQSARHLSLTSSSLRRSLHPGTRKPPTARRFTIPERNRWSGAVRVFDTDTARLYAADAPGRGAHQKYVAHHALDGEILVDGADDMPFGFGNQESIPSHRKLLWSKAMVVSVAEKAGHDPVRRD